MPKLLYLHGFNSSPASHKAQVTLAYLQKRKLAENFICPELPDRPAQAAALIKTIISKLAEPPVLIGSSLGGFYANWAAEAFDCRAVLVNPSVRSYERFEGYLGVQRNLYTGREYLLTMDHVNELAILQPAATNPARYWLMVETADETLDYRQAVAYYAGCRQTIIEGGDHGFQNWERLLPEVISWAGLA